MNIKFQLPTPLV